MSQTLQEMPVGPDRQAGAAARMLRLRKGLTLDQLAELSGLSKGHLSRFERGQKSLSIASLIRLASALDTSVSLLLGENVDEGHLHVVRAGSRGEASVVSDDGGYTYSVLSRAGGRDAPIVFLVDFPARARRSMDAYHGGEETIFVLEGSVEVLFPDRSITLDQGDFLQFPGHIKHVVQGLSDHSQLLISVFDAR